MKAFACELGVDPPSRFNDKFLIVEAALIMMLSSRAEKQYLKVDMDEFLREFPDFAKIDDPERTALLNYRNMMAAALEVVPGKWNSNHLLDVVTRIVEGKETKYVTGSGATKQTRNRIKIYDKLANIEKKQKKEFYDTAIKFLTDSAAGGGTSSVSALTGADVMENFKVSLEAPHLPMETSTHTFAHPTAPSVKITTTEVKTKSAADTISCKTTKVMQAMTDAVTGNSFDIELARGVSVASTGGNELWGNIDLLCDAEPNSDGSHWESETVSMLQEHGRNGIQMHRGTSGSHEGVIHNISLTRQVSRDSVFDTAGQQIDVVELARDHSLFYSL
jgi:hypothetical protein